MRRNMYYEGMRGNLDKVNKGDLLGFRAYKGTLELNLPINYPIVFELYEILTWFFLSARADFSVYPTTCAFIPNNSDISTTFLASDFLQ